MKKLVLLLMAASLCAATVKASSLKRQDCPKECKEACKDKEKCKDGKDCSKKCEKKDKAAKDKKKPVKA
jgi:hypothetical protein